MTNGEKYKTAKERAEAFREYCRNKGDLCRETQGIGCIDCQMLWLDIEAPAEEPLPCPFCGKKKMYAFSGTEVNGYEWHCACPCGYKTPDYSTKDAAIAAHNRVARAAKEKEANDANA